MLASKRIFFLIMVALLSFQIFMCTETAYAVLPELVLDSTDGMLLWSLGNITFDGTPYDLATSFGVEIGTYIAEYVPETGYAFVRWSTIADVSVDDEYANPVNVTVGVGGGVLVAIFEELVTYQMILESHDPITLLWGKGNTIFNGTSYDLPEYDLYKEAGTYTAEYIPEFGYEFLYWNTFLGANIPDNNANPVEVTLFDDGVLVAFYTEVPAIESCDSIGAKKDIFQLSDKVYAKGIHYAANTTYDVYVVEDVTWVDGMAIPPIVPGTTTTITSDANGNVPATLLWNNPLAPGKYDIMVDVDGDGLYYAESDALDDDDIEVTAGFFVVPEFWLGTILGLGGCLAALGVFLVFKRKNN